MEKSCDSFYDQNLIENLRSLKYMDISLARLPPLLLVIFLLTETVKQIY